VRRLKLEYYCFMLRLYRILKVRSKSVKYWAKIFVLAADMKIIGNRSRIVTEYDI
jgi:hypothetical protein